MYVRGYLQGSENGRVVTIVRFVVYCTCAKYRVVEYYRVFRFIDVILELISFNVYVQ